MAQAGDQASSTAGRTETLLLAVTKNGTVKLGLPPRHRDDNYHKRAKDVGKLKNVSHVLCSPEGELFCVRGGDLYRGPLPSKEGADWFSTAKRVGKSEWSDFQFLFFHPNGELYGVTAEIELYKGPQPKNDNVPWMHGQATNIWSVDKPPVVSSVFPFYTNFFFDPSGLLCTKTIFNQLKKEKLQTTTQLLEKDWKACTGVGEGDWLENIHFASFCPDGKLWTVNKNGDLYRGSSADDGGLIKKAYFLGSGYHQFRFLCFTKDKTISSILSFQFLPERGEIASESPEVIEEKIYNNRSTSVLKHTFIFDKTVKTSSSFSHEHGFTFEIGAKLTFKAGIPCIAKTKASVHMSLSTTNTWSFTETNETEVKFSSSSEVEVAPGKAIRVVASVVKAEMNVPYRARVGTVFGSEAEIEGTWQGASVYNLMVTQEDYGN